MLACLALSPSDASPTPAGRGEPSSTPPRAALPLLLPEAASTKLVPKSRRSSRGR